MFDPPGTKKKIFPQEKQSFPQKQQQNHNNEKRKKQDVVLTIHAFNKTCASSMLLVVREVWTGATQQQDQNYTEKPVLINQLQTL